jgi:hypothetical protein
MAVFPTVIEHVVLVRRRFHTHHRRRRAHIRDAPGFAKLDFVVDLATVGCVTAAHGRELAPFEIRLQKQQKQKQKQEQK